MMQDKFESVMESPESHFRKYLESKGLKFNWEHEAVCRAVFTIHAHFSRKQLAKNLENKIDENELRKILGLMIEAKLVRKIVLDENKVFYEHIYGHAHHDHMVCVSCGKVIEFYSPEIESEQESVAFQHKFKMLRHHMRIEGICEQCQKEGRTGDDEFHSSVQTRNREIPLTMLENGGSGVITSFNCLQWRMKKFMNMGLRIGDQIQVVKNSFDGPIVILHEDTQMEIDQGTAHRILVTRMLEKSFPPSRRRRGRHCRRHQHFMHGQHGFPAQNANGANWLARFQKHGLAADEMTLQDCKEGDRVRIVSVSGWGPFTRRMLEMGFIPGEIVEVKKYAPLFDPIEFIIKGSHVSLRRSEAALVRVEPLEEKEN